MADVRDTLPRSTLTPTQQRRLAGLQAAVAIVGRPSNSEHVGWIMRVGRYIADGD